MWLHEGPVIAINDTGIEKLLINIVRSIPVIFIEIPRFTGSPLSRAKLLLGRVTTSVLAPRLTQKYHGINGSYNTSLLHIAGLYDISGFFISWLGMALYDTSSV